MTYVLIPANKNNSITANEGYLLDLFTILQPKMCLLSISSSSDFRIMVKPLFCFESLSFLHCHINNNLWCGCIVASVQNLVTAWLAEALLTLFLAWNVTQHVQNGWK